MALPDCVKEAIYQILALLAVVVSVYVKQMHAADNESMEVDYEELDCIANLHGNRQSHQSSTCGRRNLLLLGMINERLHEVAHRVIEQRSVGRLTHYYVKPRAIDWWNFYVMATRGDDQRFKEVFRLPVSLLQQVSSFLYEHLCQRDIPEALMSISGRVISVEKMVAIAILRLASGARLIEIGEHLGVGKSTVSKIVYKFVDGLLQYKNHFIHWPRDPDDMAQVKEGSEHREACQTVVERWT
ncbi:hypothetical protein L7F22_069277 [Adiantum nelumboides]|nr:hypothetical protein [Adiantum nelumboides]